MMRYDGLGCDVWCGVVGAGAGAGVGWGGGAGWGGAGRGGAGRGGVGWCGVVWFAVRGVLTHNRWPQGLGMVHPNVLEMPKFKKR